MIFFFYMSCIYSVKIYVLTARQFSASTLFPLSFLVLLSFMIQLKDSNTCMIFFVICLTSVVLISSVPLFVYSSF